MNKIQSSLMLKSALQNLYAVLRRSDNDAQIRKAISLISEVSQEIESDLKNNKSGGNNG